MVAQDPRYGPTTAAEQSLWQRVLVAWDRDDIACRRELALAYTKKYPQNIAGWIGLADALTKLAEYGAASAALRKANRLSKSSLRHQVAVWTNFGHLHRERGDLRRAIQYYRRAADRRPTTSALVFLGAALAKRGDFTAAKRCHRRAARLATENPDEAYFNLGLILRAERRYREALKYFDLAIAHDPNYSVARAARGDCVRALAVSRQRRALPAT